MALHRCAQASRPSWMQTGRRQSAVRRGADPVDAAYHTGARDADMPCVKCEVLPTRGLNRNSTLESGGRTVEDSMRLQPTKRVLKPDIFPRSRLTSLAVCSQRWLGSHWFPAAPALAEDANSSLFPSLRQRCCVTVSSRGSKCVLCKHITQLDFCLASTTASLRGNCFSPFRPYPLIRAEARSKQIIE